MQFVDSIGLRLEDGLQQLLLHRLAQEFQNFLEALVGLVDLAENEHDVFLKIKCKPTQRPVIAPIY